MSILKVVQAQPQQLTLGGQMQVQQPNPATQGILNMLAAPRPTPKPQRVFLPAQQFHGTDTGYDSVQGGSMPQLDVTSRQPAYAGGMDIRQMNVPNIYTHPSPMVRTVLPPAFQRLNAMPGYPVPFGSGRATAAAPPQMVNVPWSATPVPYEQSLHPPRGY